MMMISKTSTAMIPPVTTRCWYILRWGFGRGEGSLARTLSRARRACGGRKRKKRRRKSRGHIHLVSLVDKLQEVGATGRTAGSSPSASHLHGRSQCPPSEAKGTLERKDNQLRRVTASPRDNAHRIPRILDLLPLPTQVPKDICALLLRLQRDPLTVRQPARPIIECRRALQQTCSVRIGVGVV